MSEAKRYNLRPMIDGDNVMDWPRDLRRGPYVVIATDYDDLLARCEAAETRLRAGTPSPDESNRHTVIEEIAAERRRQIEVEGWTPEHDDEHVDGSLALAAICYVGHVAGLPEWLFSRYSNGLPLFWPASWSRDWWKPKDWRRDLVRAAALLAAEYERLERAEAQEPPR